MPVLTCRIMAIPQIDRSATQTLHVMCAVCEVRAFTRRIPTEGGGERWLIRAVSQTGGESWRIETDELVEGVCVLAELLGVDLSDV